MPKSSQVSLTRTIQALLYPVLSFCLRRSIRLREINELIKATLVRVALDELANKGEVVSVSKVSLMTGVHRKDVTQLLETKSPREAASNIVSKVIGQWRSDKKFTLKEGRPRPLSHTGHQSEFADLVRSVSREVNPYSVLFELERTKAVELRGEQLHLLTNEYVPYGMLEERFGIVSQDVNDLICAAEENIMAPKDVPHLHLSTSYDNVAQQEIPKIRRWFMQEGAKLHERARKFLSRFDADINPSLKDKPAGGRIVIGTFSLCEERRGSTDTSLVKEGKRGTRK